MNSDYVAVETEKARTLRCHTTGCGNDIRLRERDPLPRGWRVTEHREKRSNPYTYGRAGKAPRSTYTCPECAS